MSQFSYRLIGDPLISEITQMLRNGQSLVLLGPRGIGKRYLLHQIRDRLCRAGESPVEVEWQEHGSVSEFGKLAAILDATAIAYNPASTLEADSPEDPLLRLRLAAKQSNRPVILLCSNVDALAHHLSRRFLQHVRQGFQASWLITALTGEGSLKDLVHGPNSEFDPGLHIVLQGFDKQEFEKYLKIRLQWSQIEFANFDEALEELYRQTGGNILLMRAVFWGVLEARFQMDDASFSCVSREMITKHCAALPGSASRGLDIFHNTYRTIDREPGCWDDLRKLIDGHDRNVMELGTAPHVLEMAGVAIRRGGNASIPALAFSSEIMKAFATRFYNARRWGDLHTIQGDISAGAQFYRSLDLGQTIRPFDVDDRVDVDLVMKAVASALKSEAIEGEDNLEKLERVKKLFVESCRLVLGFREVTFWSFAGSWTSMNEPAPSDILKLKASQILPVNNEKRDLPAIGLVRLKPPLDRFANLAILPSIRADQRDAVIVSNFESEIATSRERELAVSELMNQFVSAYSHAIKVVGRQLRLDNRDVHVQIATDIFGALGGKVLNPIHALTLAAEGLRTRLGYRRVFFSLVNSTEDEIRGVPDSKDPSANALAELTRFKINGEITDIQQWVVRNARERIVPDVAADPLVNPKAVKAACVRRFVVVPILNQSDAAVGTIHVERADEKVPSDDEAKDLIAFGRQLAIAIEQSERVNLLQSSLSKLHEPVIIVDRLMRVRYANDSAHVFRINSDWRDRVENEKFQLAELSGSEEFLRDALEKERRMVRVLDDGQDPPKIAFKVHCDPVKDWRNETVAAFLHLEDVRYLHRVFQAFVRVAERARDRRSAMESMLDAAKILGHRWARFYLISGDNPDLLVGEKSYNLDDPELERWFNTEKPPLPREKDTEKETFQAIDKKTPLVFCWQPDGEAPGFQPFFTPHGLEAVTVRQPHFASQLKKLPGEFWIDLPFITDQRPWGKLSLQCDAQFLPEEFELLRLLAVMVSELWEKAMEKESFEKLTQILRDASDRAVAMASHNITARLAALPLQLAQYRNREAELPKLKEINDDLSDNLQSIGKTIERITEKFTVPKAKLNVVELRSYIEQTMASVLMKGTWELKAPDERLFVELDVHLFGTAIDELIRNSSAACSKKALRITLVLVRAKHGNADRIHFLFSDNGPGVPEAFKKQIFDPFFSRRSAGKLGTGLGLYFARKVMEAHGGSIDEVGTEGSGATFLFDFPATTE